MLIGDSISSYSSNRCDLIANPVFHRALGCAIHPLRVTCGVYALKSWKECVEQKTIAPAQAKKAIVRSPQNSVIFSGILI